MTGARDLAAALRRDHPDPSILAGGLTGRSNPSTSARAAQTDFGGARRSIEGFVRESGLQGVTAADVAYEGLAESVQLAGARLLELRGDRLGLTRRVGRLFTAAGWVTRARAGYRPGVVHVHVAFESELPEGQSLAPSADRTPCKFCGHVRRSLPWHGPDDGGAS